MKDRTLPFLAGFLAGFLTAILIIAIFQSNPVDAASLPSDPISVGDRGQDVRQVQYVLRSHGYVLEVDGIYGLATAKAVTHWQRANGLLPDGVVGPITWDRLVGPALATAPAVRVTPPAGKGLGGLSFAPAGTGGCDEMRFYRQQAGLPSTFDALGWRESNCRNDVRTFCCYGYWQNYISSHLSERSSYRSPILIRCEVNEVSDIFGNAPLQKQKQACVTAVVYWISGYSPWALS